MGYFFTSSKFCMYNMFISTWGAIMLTLMGIFFKVRSVSLFEDVHHDDWGKVNYTPEYIQEQYDISAINCWIAAMLYTILLFTAVVFLKFGSNPTVELS